jgi:uncharacterized protein YjbJ (UPF0337 family)
MTDEIEHIKGKAKDLKGHAREEIGKLTHNESEQVKGKMEQAEGEAREQRAKRKT